MKFALCPHERITNSYSYNSASTGQSTLTWRSDISVYGKLYPFDIMQNFLLSGYNISLSKDFEGENLSTLFDADTKGVCAHYEVPSNASPTSCTVSDPYTAEPTAAIQHACISITELNEYYTTDKYLEFSWNDLQLNLQLNQNTTSITSDPHLLVLSDSVIDIKPYILMNKKIFGDNVDLLLRQTAGQDGTYIFSAWEDGKDAWPCIVARYSAGVISSDTMGCIIYEIVTDFFLAVVIMLMTIRYSMALVFHWWVSPRLTIPGGRSKGILAWRSIAGGNQFPKHHRPSNTSSLNTLVASNSTDTMLPSRKRSFTASTTEVALVENDPRHTILFVTCYSEGEESIKSSLDSLVETAYSDSHKLLFIVADGIITGSGNSKPTSEICRDLLDLVDCEQDEEESGCDYEAIADGYKRINQAQVYVGHYRSVPALLVIKCGNEIERSLIGNKKPGNRGKRDSQMILMTFFQRVIFYDTFSPLEYEIFWKMRKIMKGKNLTPDKFELVLMVDADTRVDPDSITHMVSAMNNDITLMGLCGETKVANKSETWVTSIQVFEYFISHHYAKAFESMFGGVTCLPGCFSMYRIKAPKNGGWIPILASPDIIQEFNLTTVNTLHAKNLLLLGEDRFLSTLMLRVFPRRQMIFVPRAKCRTVVPSSFKVLLSQRRRWINSTVHNLMELALVSDLCGIACLSMQFIVVIDLFSSIVLPAALVLLLFFFINLGFTDSPQYQPLFILLVTLGLPAILILLTAKKVSYIGWMTSKYRKTSDSCKI
jgi:chitin synthase